MREQKKREQKRREQKKPGTKRERIIGLHKRSREPVDYGVTKKQFYTVLEKVSQSVKKPESETEKAQT